MPESAGGHEALVQVLGQGLPRLPVPREAVQGCSMIAEVLQQVVSNSDPSNSTIFAARLKHSLLNFEICQNVMLSQEIISLQQMFCS